MPADRLLVGLLLGTLAATATAQQQATRLQMRLASSLLVSDDLNAEPGKDGGVLLNLAPGLSLVSRGAELRGSLDYSLGLVKAWRTERRPDSLQHSLNAQMQYAQQSGGFGLDARAGVGSQSRSAFGPQRPSGGGQLRLDDNQNEVYTLSLTPSWRSRIGSWATAGVTHQVQVNRVRDSDVGDASTQSTSVDLGSAQRGPWGWGLRYNDSRTNARRSRDTRTQSATASLSWRPDIDWDFGANAGKQRSNLQTQSRRDGSTYGLSASWRPTPRSSLAAKADRNVFGNTHNLSLQHRFSRASVRLSESRSVQSPGVGGAVAAFTHYELLFAQLAAIEPDPLLRDLLVRAQLQQLGLDPNAVAITGFLSSRPSLSRQQLLGLTWQTQRSNWALNLSRSESERFGLAFEGFDDFAESRVLVSEGAGFSVSYRLTPIAGLSAALQWQRNRGDLASQRTEQRSGNLSWNTRLGPSQQLSLSLRHTQFESPQRGYEENSLLLSYQQQF